MSVAGKTVPVSSGTPGQSLSDITQGKGLAGDRFAEIGAFGFRSQQIAILASLVTQDPLLLIGRSGTGKTYLLNSISEALGLEHRHYNASLIAFDDLVGFPYPDEAREKIRFLQTPATIWGAESVLVDEISRCKPEHQNRLFSLVHERRIQGMELDTLRYRWAAMNPCLADQDSAGEYLGSEPLDPALADRFSVIVETGDWIELSELQQRAITDPGGEGLVVDESSQLRNDVNRWQCKFKEALPATPLAVNEYARIVTSELGETGVRISPRRARLIARSLLAATVIEGGVVESSFRVILECSIPHRAWGEKVSAEKIIAAHRIAWDANMATGSTKWLNNFHLKRTFVTKLRYLVKEAPSNDIGTLAIEQFITNESPERSAAFALACYPAAIEGRLPIGSDAIADLGRIAGPLLTVVGELKWQERLSVKNSSHPELTRFAAILETIEDDKRCARARQLFYWALVNDVPIEKPAQLEQEMNKTIEFLAELSA